MHRYESWLLQVPVWALKYCMARGLSLSHYLKVASSFQMRTTIGFIWRQSGWSIYTWLLQCVFKEWQSTDVETAASTEVIPQEVRSFLSKQNDNSTFWALLWNFIEANVCGQMSSYVLSVGVLSMWVPLPMKARDVGCSGAMFISRSELPSENHCKEFELNTASWLKYMTLFYKGNKSLGWQQANEMEARCGTFWLGNMHRAPGAFRNKSYIATR